MKKTKYKIIISIIILFLIAIIPSISNAAKVKVDKVKSLKAKEITTSKATISWKKVSGAKGYEVYLYNNTTKKFKKYKTTSKTSLRVKKLDYSQKYIFKVRAYKKQKGKKYFGKYSSNLKFATKPIAVKNLATKSQTNNSITMQWDKIQRATGYTIYVRNEITGKYDYYADSKNNYVEIKKLEPAKTYKVRVRAFKDAKGKKYYGDYSEKIKSITLPDTIKKLRLKENTSETLTIEWDKNDKALGYVVYKLNKETQNWEVYKEVTDTYITMLKSEIGSSYNFKVCAFISFQETKLYGYCSNPFMTKEGIDVSAHQKDINWEKVKNAGVDFVIIRCGYGKDIVKQDDKYFEKNVSECERLGIPYGIYIYSYALDTENAKSEADHALRLLKGHNPQYGVWFDMEDADKYKIKKGMPSNETLVDICSTFCDILIKNGYKTGIYASLSWFKNQLSSEKLDKYDKWVAQWNKVCTYNKPYVMWQYADNGSVDGIEGRVDMNIGYF